MLEITKGDNWKATAVFGDITINGKGSGSGSGSGSGNGSGSGRDPRSRTQRRPRGMKYGGTGGQRPPTTPEFKYERTEETTLTYEYVVPEEHEEQTSEEPQEELAPDVYTEYDQEHPQDELNDPSINHDDVANSKDDIGFDEQADE